MWGNKKFILIFKILTIALFTLSICFQGIAEAGDPKYLYVITDADIPNIGDTTVSSYKIKPATQYLTLQNTNNEWFTGDPLKITVDTDSKCLFVTYRATYGIQIIDGDTMESLGVGLAPPGSNWEGFRAVAMDQDKQLLYAVECWTNVLYIFRWDAISKTLDFETTVPLLISSVQDGYVYSIDIALDEIRDLLFVATYGGTVYYFNTADWSFAGTYTITNPNICYFSIAVDERNRFVYTGNPSDTTSVSGLGYLIKYDLNNNQQNYITLDPNNYITGLAVDQATSLLYATTGYYPLGPNNTRYEGSDEIRVYNSDLTLLYLTNAGVVDPRGLCVHREDRLGLGKDDGLATTECVSVRDNITYEICYDNTLNNVAVRNVTIEDLIPLGTEFVSATGNYSIDPNNVITWDIGTLPAEADTNCVELVVKIDPNITAPGDIIYNSASINSDQTSSTMALEETEVCSYPPVANAGPDQTVEQTSYDGALVKLDGSKSYDPDGYPLTYKWTWCCESATGKDPNVTLPVGTTTVTLTVDDGYYTDSNTVVITVVDTTPPVINSLTARPDILPSTCWSNMATVIITSDVHDICDRTPTCKITDVEVTYSDTPSWVPLCSLFTSRSSYPEWEITGDMTLNVNTQNIYRCFANKIFTITVKCIDASGNSATSQTTVTIQKGFFSRNAAFRSRRVRRR